MTPRLPGRLRSLARLLAGAVVLLAAAAPVRALEIATVTAARDDGGQLWVTTRLEDPLEARIEKSLARGMPATLQVHAELWRRREGWFDRMERSADLGVRLRYDVWREEWRIERSGAPAVLLHSVDSVEVALSRPIAVPLTGLQKLPDDGRCYVVVTVTVKPLSVEDVQEVEGWVSGEVRDQRRAGFGVITALPRSLFDAVRNFTGFGDSHDRAVTPEFTPGGLPLLAR